MLSGNLYGKLCVISCGKRALCRHFSKNQEPSAAHKWECLGMVSLSQRLDDPFPGEYAGIDEVGPFRNAERAAVVLHLDSVTYVNELPIFKNEKVVFLGERFQASDRLFT